MAVQRTKFASGSGLRTQNLALSDYKRFKGRVEADMERIMQGAGEIVLEETNKFFTPKETGALMESGRVELRYGPKGVSAIVKFGGDDAPVFIDKNTPDGIVTYAVMVHEGTGKQPPNKYLEYGGISSQRKVDKHIITELRKIEPK